MNKQIIYLLILTTLSVLGILIFQGYWLFESYQVQKTQFHNDANQALQVAVNEEFQNRLSFEKDSILVDGISGDSLDRRSTMAHILTRMMGNKLESKNDSDFSANLKIDSLGLSNSSPVFYLKPNNDENEKRIDTQLQSILSKGQRPLKRQILDSLYNEELSVRGIETAYSLDFYGTDSRKTVSGTDSLSKSSDNAFTTRKVAIGLLDSHFVQASFSSQVKFLLSEMAYILGASILLLIITLGCYGYMLVIIYRQKKVSEVKNDFINNMTHEFKTPISTTSAAIEALQSFDVLNNPKRTEKYLEISQKELNRLSGLVNKVLKVAAYEKQQLDINVEKIDVNEMLASIVNQNQVRYKEQAQFKYINQADNLTLNADKTHTTNAIQNLIDNAVKYGGDSGIVTIEANQLDGQIQIMIRDEGPGIPSSYQDKIFEKFYRIPTGNIHNVKGFGLGLNYVRQVIERHGGIIKLESKEGFGSAFFIKLPTNQ